MLYFETSKLKKKKCHTIMQWESILCIKKIFLPSILLAFDYSVLCVNYLGPIEVHWSHMLCNNTLVRFRELIYISILCFCEIKDQNVLRTK